MSKHRKSLPSALQTIYRPYIIKTPFESVNNQPVEFIGVTYACRIN